MPQIIDELDTSGYYSVLFPIESVSADYLPQAIRSINSSQKIKYMIPIRPYLLSPQYLAMLSSGIEKIAPGRTIFNFIHGHLSEDENLDGVIASSVDFSNADNRKAHLEDFIHTLKNIKMYDQPDFSDCIVSGGSQEILEIANRLGVAVATSYTNYISNYEIRYSKFNFKKVYAQVCILSRETDEEAELVKNSLGATLDQTGVLCGSYKSVAESIYEAERMGVTDFLVSPAFNGGFAERQQIHKFLKYMTNESDRVNMSAREA
jgi:alkanesulfonate monooxygenase SsuD/methylene tetrahydromethanopterin reductase-like flavin-dependent oxidoreductase (luciferase family)